MPYIDTKIKPEELAVGTSVCLDLDNEQIGLFKTSDGLFAINNMCPHQGAPLHDGMMGEGFVTCPWHQWQFQLNDGKCRNIPGVGVTAYPLEVQEGTIRINLEPKK